MDAQQIKEACSVVYGSNEDSELMFIDAQAIIYVAELDGWKFDTQGNIIEAPNA